MLWSKSSVAVALNEYVPAEVGVPDKVNVVVPLYDRLSPGIDGAVLNPQVTKLELEAVADPLYAPPTVPSGKLKDQVGGAGVGWAIVIE